MHRRPAHRCNSALERAVPPRAAGARRHSGVRRADGVPAVPQSAALVPRPAGECSDARREDDGLLYGTVASGAHRIPRGRRELTVVWCSSTAVSGSALREDGTVWNSRRMTAAA